MQAVAIPYRLSFKRPAGTSRGVLHYKDTYFLILAQDGKTGIGECALFRGLSADDRADYELTLNSLVEKINDNQPVRTEDYREWPSIVFGLETALRSLASQRNDILFPSDFTSGKSGIRINGLIWMGDRDFMFSQIKEKIEAGFRVIKMKIGALDFETEWELLRYIRTQFGPSDIEIRVDANGAFTPEEALSKLEKLARLQIHSIEQPVKPGQWELMAELCRKSPLPVALDEELIGIFHRDRKEELIRNIKPRYIILKPSLTGGFTGTDEWIETAEKNQVGWWITSALESNVGLNAIAQFTFSKNVKMPQGLGTGGLFVNNIDSPLYIRKDELRFDPGKSLSLPGALYENI